MYFVVFLCLNLTLNQNCIVYFCYYNHSWYFSITSCAVTFVKSVNDTSCALFIKSVLSNSVTVMARSKSWSDLNHDWITYVIIWFDHPMIWSELIGFDLMCNVIRSAKVNKCLANAKRPCDCRVLCLHLKSSLCSWAHYFRHDVIRLSSPRSWHCVPSALNVSVKKFKKRG